MSQITEGTLRKLYRKINWDHKLRTDLLEPIWRPNVVKVIESGEKVVNNDKSNEAKKARRKEQKKKRNNQGCNEIKMSRSYHQRLKNEKEFMEKIIYNTIESNENKIS